MQLSRSERKIYQKIPSCLTVCLSCDGTSIKAKEAIPTGSIIDTSVSFCFLENTDDYYELVLSDWDETIPLHSLTNTLRYTENERVCNGYVGFINHHCTKHNVTFNTSNQFGFSIVAARDIECGEELVSNYLLFDYTCDGHTFDCQCSAGKGFGCYEKIAGFRGLTAETQYKLLPYVTNSVLHSFVQEKFVQDDLSALYAVHDIDDSFHYVDSGPPVDAFSCFCGGTFV